MFQERGQPGNLYIHLGVKDDPRFERDGADLHTAVDISFSRAALGGVVEIPLVSGRRELRSNLAPSQENMWPFAA